MIKSLLKAPPKRPVSSCNRNRGCSLTPARRPAQATQKIVRTTEAPEATTTTSTTTTTTTTTTTPKPVPVKRPQPASCRRNGGCSRRPCAQRNSSCRSRTQPCRSRSCGRPVATPKPTERVEITVRIKLRKTEF